MKVVKRVQKQESRKIEAAAELERLVDQSRDLDKRIELLKTELSESLDVAEAIGRVTKVEVKSKVITPGMEKALKEAGHWEAVLAEPKVEMKKLDGVLRLAPKLSAHLSYKTSYRIEVGKSNEA